MKQPSSSAHRSIRSHQCHYSCSIPMLFFLLLVAVLYGEDFSSILTQPLFQQHGQEEKNDTKLAFAVGETPKGCNIFTGKWVYDEASRPHYAEPECPYIHPQLTCQRQGRPDKTYQNWRWQPHGCSLPSFNATLMLENLRGKRLLFVGDSLNRGQFVSMVCLLHRAIADGDKSMETFGSLTVFRAKEYNATVEFYWAPFLAESNSDNAIVHRVKDRVVRVGSLEKHSKHWRGADVVVFNTYVWWMTGRMMNTIEGPLSSGIATKEMQTEEAYRATMRSMVRWVEENMDPQKTRVFFMTMSPAHEKSKEWGGEPGGNCYNETLPIEDPKYWGSFSNKTIMRALGEELRRSKVPIVVVNITQLSEYRKDAHTSVYKKQWNPLTPEQMANPRSYADCIHWCLPGLQDTWNQLLYTKLFFP